MTFGEKLQALRAREGLSQDALAELMNVSRQAVSRWERDETMPETEKVIRLSDHFHVTTDYLLKEGTENRSQEAQTTQTSPDWKNFLRGVGLWPNRKDLWNRYGFLLGWALAALGLSRTFRVLPLGAMLAGEAGSLQSALYGFLVLFFPGVPAAAAGILLACLWRRAGRFRRQALGWAVVLWSGLQICFRLLLALSAGQAPPLRWILLRPALLAVLALGLCLALIPPLEEPAKG